MPLYVSALTSDWGSALLHCLPLLPPLQMRYHVSTVEMGVCMCVCKPVKNNKVIKNWGSLHSWVGLQHLDP